MASSPRLAAWRSRFLRFALALFTCWLTFVMAASGRFAGRGALEALAGALVVGGMACLLAYHRPGWVPVVLIGFGALIPYQVSFVGKTPFGVVTATGALGFVALTALIAFHARGRRDLFRGADVAALLIWIALLVLSGALGSDHRQSLNAARVIAVAVPMAYLAGRLVAQLDALALRRVVILLGTMSLLAILEEVTRVSVYDLFPSEGFPLTPPPPVVRSGLERVRLGYYHGAMFGTVLAVGATAVVAHRLVGPRRTPRWILPALLVALVCTVTFQVWVAAFLALALLGLGLQRVRLGLVAGALAGGLVIMTGVVPAVNQLIENRIHPTGSNADEYAFRAQLWPASVHYAAHAPLLGSGTGLFNELGVTGTVRNTRVNLVDDNSFTAKLVETGYPGLLALFAVLILVSRRMLMNHERWRVWAGLGALVAWTLMAFSVDALAGDQALLPCWLLLGMLSYSPGPESS